MSHVISSSDYSIDGQQTSALLPVFNRAAGHFFKERIARLVEEQPHLANSFDIKESYSNYDCWLARDLKSGFAVAPNLELVNVFALIKGHGRQVMSFALERYDGLHLNCYAGGVEERFYAASGFHAFRREANWADGGPDVVYMVHRPSRQSALRSEVA